MFKQSRIIWLRVSLTHAEWHLSFKAHSLRLYVAKQLIVPWWRKIARSTLECSGRCLIGQQKLETCGSQRRFENQVWPQPLFRDLEVKESETRRESWIKVTLRFFLSVIKKVCFNWIARLEIMLWQRKWRSIWTSSWFPAVNKRNRNSSVTEMKAGLIQSDLRSSEEQLPQLKLTRRTAICSVIEENDQRQGLSLAEVRRELVSCWMPDCCDPQVAVTSHRTELKTGWNEPSNVSLNFLSCKTIL